MLVRKDGECTDGTTGGGRLYKGGDTGDDIGDLFTRGIGDRSSSWDCLKDATIDGDGFTAKKWLGPGIVWCKCGE